MKLTQLLCTVACCVAALAFAQPASAQKLFDDHDLEDRFYITLGGFAQDDLRTTLSLNAKTAQGGIAAGAVIAVESLFSVDDRVTTARLDGWYRLNRKHRLAWTYWRTSREGLSTYQGEDLIIGDITLSDGDYVSVDDKSTLFAINYAYSFVNLEKFEAWLGAGFNFQTIDTTIVIDVGGGGVQTLEEQAKGTIPIPTMNFGLRYTFNKRLRMLVMQNLFGLKIGNYSGKLDNTRLLAEFNITKNFGFGGGFERFNFEVDAETEDFTGSMDMSYTGLSLYLKGQF